MGVVTPLARIALKDESEETIVEEKKNDSTLTFEGLLYATCTLLYVYILLLSPNSQIVPGTMNSAHSSCLTIF